MTAHLLNFGGSFTQVNTWTTSVNGTQIIPTIAFGVATGDPIITGATNMFTAANFPGASATDMQTNAPALYALLTGRVSAINRSVVLDEETKTVRRRISRSCATSSAKSAFTSRIPGASPAPDVQLRRALGSPESAGQPERRLHAAGLCGRVGRLRRGQSVQARRADRPGAGVQCRPRRASPDTTSTTSSSRLRSAWRGSCRRPNWTAGVAARQERQRAARGLRHQHDSAKTPARSRSGAATRAAPSP